MVMGKEGWMCETFSRVYLAGADRLMLHSVTELKTRPGMCWSPKAER